MSYRERSAWISLACTLGVYGYYFLTVWAALQSGAADTGEFIGLFVRSVVTLIVLYIVVAIGLAILLPRDKHTPADERERQIDLKASRFALMVLNILIVTLALASPAIAGASPLIARMNPVETATFVMANGILLAVVIADLVRTGGQILLYRLGA